MQFYANKLDVIWQIIILILFLLKILRWKYVVAQILLHLNNKKKWLWLKQYEEKHLNLETIVF